MGFYKNDFMENSKKIVIYFVLSVIFFSCKGQEKKITDNDFISENNNGDVFFKVPYFLGKKETKNFYTKNDTIFFKTVSINGAEKNIKKNIDLDTFTLIPSNEKEKKEINNTYYLNNPFYNYFKDKSYIYIYIGDNLPNPIFFQIGNAKDYKILGGAYLQINNKVYWRGIEVLKADINSFKVINVQRNKSEWQASIGMDDNHIYLGDKIMNYEHFLKNYFWSNQTDLQKKYFPNK